MGPDCAGTPGHLKNAGLYLESSEEPVRGLSRYNTELSLKSDTLATASKLEHRDVRGSLQSGIERRKMMAVGLVWS